jgi:glycosyltransferase involved in cell wall biosynthesis
MSLTSVIIPAYNVGSSIGIVLQNLLDNQFLHEVIVVDDCSTDDTAAVMAGWAERAGKVKLVSMAENGGAGAARNAGLQVASGRYLYFLDADDRPYPGAVDMATKVLEQTGADVVTFKHRHVFGNNAPSPMWPIDEDSWREICGNLPLRCLTLQEDDRILFTVNFPWNKIIRADFYKSTGLKFSQTRVHNDVYAHWHIYLHARKIALLNQYMINHLWAPQVDQLSNVFNRKRFDIFTAIAEVEALFQSLPPASRAHRAWFFAFKADITTWIYPRLSAELRDEFSRRVEELFESFSDEDYFATHAKRRKSALDSLGLKFATKALLDATPL